MATADIEGLLIKIAADTSSLKKELQGAKNSVNDFATTTQRRMKATGASMKRLGRQMTMFVTLPVVAGVTAGIKAFSNFDKAMTTSTAIMGDMTDELRNRMAATAKQISEETPTSATKAAEAYFFLASAGMDAEESIRSLSHVNQFAIAGQFDMATATDLLTDAQSALGMSIGTTAMKTAALVRVSDVLVKANTLANATVEQFSTALTSKAGASLRSFNKDIEEGVAVLAVYADQGIKAELAGNNLDRVLRLLSDASMKNAAAFKEAGFDVFDANGEMRNMADIIQNLEQVMAGLSPEMVRIKLATLGFEARVQQAIMPLLGFSEAIRDNEEALRNSAGTTNDVVVNQLEAFEAQMQTTWNSIKNVSAEIGEKFIPFVQHMAGEIEALIEWWRSWDDWVQNLVLGFIAFMAILGPTLIAMGTLIGMLAAIQIGYTKATIFLALYGGTSKLATIAQWALNMAMAAMPVLAVLAAAAAIIAVAVAIGRALAGYGELKAAQKERDRLDKEWMKMWETTNIKEMNELTSMEDGIEKQKEFGLAIKRAENNVQGMNLRLKLQKDLLKEMEDAGASYGAVGSEVYTAEKDNLNQMLDQKEMYKQHQKDLIEAAEHHNQVLEDQKAIEEGRAIRGEIYAEETDAIVELNQKLEHQIATYGMSASQIEMYNAAQKGATEEQLKELQAIADKNDAMEAELQARKDEEKAIQEQKDAEEELLRTKEQMNQALDDELATFHMNAAEKAEYAAIQAGLNEEEAFALKLKTQILENMKAEKKALEEEQKLKEKGEQLRKSVRKPEEKFREGQKELNDLLQKGAIDLETYTRAMEKLKEDTTVQIKFKVSGVDAVAAGSAEAAARLEEFQALRSGGEKVDFKAQGQDLLNRRPRINAAPGIPAEEKQGAENLNNIAQNTRILAERIPVVIEEAGLA